jgi:hypothetical protein
MTEWWLIAIAFMLLAVKHINLNYIVKRCTWEWSYWSREWMMKDANRTFSCTARAATSEYFVKNINIVIAYLSRSSLIGLRLENTCKSILVFSYDLTRPKFLSFLIMFMLNHEISLQLLSLYFSTACLIHRWTKKQLQCDLIKNKY